MRKKHDTATTPLRRLLDQHADLLDPHDQHRLEQLLHSTDVIALRHQIADIQGNPTELTRRRGTIQPKTRTNAVYLSRRKMAPKRAKPDESTNHPSRAS